MWGFFMEVCMFVPNYDAINVASSVDLSRIEQLEQQNAKLVEALEKINKIVSSTAWASNAIRVSSIAQQALAKHGVTK